MDEIKDADSLSNFLSTKVELLLEVATVVAIVVVPVAVAADVELVTLVAFIFESVVELLCKAFVDFFVALLAFILHTLRTV